MSSIENEPIRITLYQVHSEYKKFLEDKGATNISSFITAECDDLFDGPCNGVVFFGSHTTWIDNTAYALGWVEKAEGITIDIVIGGVGCKVVSAEEFIKLIRSGDINV